MRKKKTVGLSVSIEKIQRISQKKNGKRLTAKQAKAVQVYAETGNISEAGRQAYTTQTTERSKVISAQETMKKPAIQNVLVEIMETKGLTDDYLSEKLKNGIENGKDQGFNHLKLAFELKGKLNKTSINLSHTIKETRKAYEL